MWIKEFEGLTVLWWTSFVLQVARLVSSLFGVVEKVFEKLVGKNFTR
jgi:hypothetical protein